MNTKADLCTEAMISVHQARPTYAFNDFYAQEHPVCEGESKNLSAKYELCAIFMCYFIFKISFQFACLQMQI